MKNSIELRQERAELIGKADSMLNLAKDETRDFTNENLNPILIIALSRNSIPIVIEICRFD